jgi:hypothetical protein
MELAVDGKSLVALFWIATGEEYVHPIGLQSFRKATLRAIDPHS